MIPVHRPASSPIVTVTRATFESLVLRGSGPTVVEFMTYGCVHCRAIERSLEEVAESLASAEHFYRVNVAVEDELATLYRVESTPTFIMFLDGVEVGRARGPDPSVPSVRRIVTQPFAP